jgi:hypothetical protein
VRGNPFIHTTLIVAASTVQLQYCTYKITFGRAWCQLMPHPTLQLPLQASHFILCHWCSFGLTCVCATSSQQLNDASVHLEPPNSDMAHIISSIAHNLYVGVLKPCTNVNLVGALKSIKTSSLTRYFDTIHEL